MKIISLLISMAFIVLFSCSIEKNGDYKVADKGSPDLTVTFDSIGYNSNYNVICFSNIVIENIGTADSKYCDIAYGLSPDTVIFDSNDIIIYAQLNDTTLRPGEKMVIPVASINITNTLSNSFYIPYIIVDFERRANDMNYKNNVYYSINKNLSGITFPELVLCGWSPTNAVFSVLNNKNDFTLSVFRDQNNSGSYIYLGNMTGNVFTDNSISTNYDYTYRVITYSKSINITWTNTVGFPLKSLQADIGNITCLSNTAGSCWQIDYGTYYDGAMSLWSGSVYNNSTSEFTIQADTAYLSYYYKMSDSYNCSLELWIDGTKSALMPVNSQWTFFETNLSPGGHNINWKAKCSSYYPGYVWIDNFTLGAKAPANITFTITNTNTLVLSWPSVAAGATYKIFCSLDNTNNFIEITNTQSTNFIYGLISSDHDYYFQIKSEDFGYNSTKCLIYPFYQKSYSDAIDFNPICWNYITVKPWIVDVSNAIKGGSSIYSGNYTLNSSNYIEAIFTGDYLSFNYKFNAYYSDQFTFYIDGTNLSTFSNTTNWTNQSFYMTTGTHSLKWIYYQAYINANSGIWLDFITNEPNNLSEPTNFHCIYGTGNSFNLIYDSVPGAYTYDIYRSIDNSNSFTLIGTTNGNAFIDTNINQSHNYYYKVKAKRNNLSSSYSKTIFILNNFNPVLDTTGLIWSKDGTCLWALDTSNYVIGGSSLYSGKLSNFCSNYIQTTITGDYIAFYHKYNTAWTPDGELNFAIDGTNWFEIEENTWTNLELYMTPGTHTLTWADVHWGSAYSEAWIDDVTNEPSFLSNTENLYSTYNTDSSISLLWDAVPGAFSYNIYRSKDNTNSFSQIGTAITNKYIDSSINQDNNYYYKIQTRRNNLTSQDSEYYAVINNLNPVLDTTNLIWIKNGLRMWTLDSSNFIVGSNSLYVGPRNFSSSNWIQTTINSDFISFYWKLNTSFNYDYFKFYIDGINSASINQATEWTNQAFTLTPGTHTLKWLYYNNFYNYYTGAWIDGISIEPSTLTTPLNIYCISNTGNSITLVWDAVPGAYSYEIYKSIDNTNSFILIGSNTNMIFFDNDIIQSHDYYYYKIKAKRDNITSPDSDLYLLYNNLNTILDTTGLIWIDNGKKLWIPDTTNSIIGDSSLYCAILPANSSNIIQTTFTGNYISFYLKFNYNAYYPNNLKFIIDETNIIDLTWQRDWTKLSYSLTQGTHNLKWIYFESYYYDNSGAWIDGISFTP